MARKNAWNDGWYLALPPINKLVVEYLREHCDAAGVWEFDRNIIEASIGLQRLPDTWVHAGVIGIAYATKEIAEEDVLARELDPKRIRLKERINWSRVVTQLNAIPADYDGSHAPKLEAIGEGRWWFIRLMEERYGRWGHKHDGFTMEIVEKPTQNRPDVLGKLREHGLIERLKAHHPEAKIVQAASEIIAKPNPDGPTLAEVCDALEGAALPIASRRLFWFTFNETHWQNCPNWREALAAETLRWTLRQEWVTLNQMPWPETPAEREAHLAMISQRMIDESFNRIDAPGGARLSPEAAARMKIIMRTKDMIEGEIEAEK
jgi:hypothetical protein